jgi:hypothetical protein
VALVAAAGGHRRPAHHRAGYPQSAQSKEDLQLLFDEAKKNRDDVLEKRIFEARFGKKLSDEWATNDAKTDIETLWQIMAALPPSNVESNIMLVEIKLEEGGGGSYSPSTHDISLGRDALADQEFFEDTMRHEVGHAVHEQHLDEVNGWMEAAYSFRMRQPTPEQTDEWVKEMGGWPADITEAQRGEVAGYLQQALGDGAKWDPPARPQPPEGHPWWRADFGPRIAMEKTKGSWYKTNAEWHRANGKAFFLNYWYGTICTVSEDALNLIAQMPSDYAAMSPFEYFAELYALYFDLDDPKRGVLPQSITDWFNTRVSSGFQPRSFRHGARRRASFEDITRPRY